jgi:hypothetical protein
MKMRPIVELEPEEASQWSAGMHFLMYHHPPLPPLQPEVLKALDKCASETETPPEGKSWRGTTCAMDN